MRDRQPLWFYKLENGDCITCIQLPIPQFFEHMCVGACDDCQDERHLFYGYRRSVHRRTMEETVTVCETCARKWFIAFVFPHAEMLMSDA